MKNKILVLILVCFAGKIAFAQTADKDSGLFGDTNTNDGGSTGRLENLQVGFLPLPPNYNKLVIPLGNISKSIYCFVHLSIRGILDVDIINGIVEMDTEIGIFWMDWEIWDYLLSNKSRREQVIQSGTAEEIILDAEFLKYIWKPDLFIEEMASVERTSLLSKLITLKYLINNPVMPGALAFEARQTFKVRCDMEFQYYPADTQKCSLHIRSFSYSEDQIFVMWNPKQKVFLDQLDDPDYIYQVSGAEPGEELYDLFTTSQATCCNPRNFSTLTFVLQIRRDLRYHLVQTAFPSILLVFITWLCFLLPPDMIEARIGISMTTLLTMTALFAAVRQQAPSVSYPMAIDIWMVFCIFFLFVALLLFTVIYWIRRRLEGGKNNKGVEELSNGSVVTILEENNKNFKNLVRKIMKYAFVVFALVFIVFLILYPYWLLNSSDYLNWSPSEKYNALPLANGSNENRLFALQERKFSARQKKKVVNSLYRFHDLQIDVIQPKLKQLESTENEEEETTTETFHPTTSQFIHKKNKSPGG